MLIAPISFLAVTLLAGLLFFEKTGNQKGKLPTKTVLSCLFIVTALSQSPSSPGYFFMLLTGLVFCLGGDVFLALPQDRMFLCGLISFLLGHMFYAVAFFYVANLSHWIWIGASITLTLSGGIFIWLRPHLGSMLMPVIAYIAVITVMLVCAWSVFCDAGLNLSGRVLVISGAASFYVSDLFVARDRFVKTDFKNRLLGLPLYYLGQFLLAFSVGAVIRS